MNDMGRSPRYASAGDCGLPLLGGARPDFSVRSRDLFPLPVPPRLESTSGLSRRSSQRLCRKVRKMDTVREAVHGLNWLAGHGFLHDSETPPDDLQAEVLQRIHLLAQDSGNLGSLERVPSSEAALQALLKGKSEYHQPSTPVALAPYKLERVSLPEDLHGLPQDARRYLQGKELMVKEGEPLEAPPPYWDPALAKSKKQYRQFIQHLDSIGLLQYTQTPKNEVGVFFVFKSDGERIRLIVDARSTNALFQDPPGVELCSSEGFSRIECEVSPGLRPGSPEFLAELQTMNIHIGLSDVKDCFHRLRQPRWLAEYFCFKPIRAHWVGLTGTMLDGHRLGPNDVIYPMPGSLCMGFSWSLYFCQRINEYQCSLTRSLKDSTLVRDKGEPVVFRSEQVRRHGEPGSRHYVYVDNLGVLSSHAAYVKTALQELDEHFGSCGLLLHPGEVSVGETRALGTVLDGQALCSKITPERFHKVRQAIRGIVQRRRVTGQMLEVVVGHATFCGLNNRMTLAVFHTCYKFIRTHYFEPTELWSSVKDELRAFAGLMIFLRSDWWRPWNDLVCCSDASTTGYGVCTSHWKLSDVSAVGRIKERARFKRSGGHSARESSLTSAGFIKDEVTGSWKVGEIEAEDYLKLSGWTLDPHFPEVPARLLRKECWAPKLWGKWQFPEGIITLEARAAVKSLRRVAMSVFGSQIRQLFLLDNMSLVLALERSRSRQFSLLKQIRVFNSYCIARGIQPYFRWVPSELNSADEPSRYNSDEPSKLLTALIPHGPEESSDVGRPIVKQDHGQEEDRALFETRGANHQDLEGQGPCPEKRGTQPGSLHSGQSTAQSQPRGDWAHSGQPEAGQPSSSRAGCQLQQLRQQQRGNAHQEEGAKPPLPRAAAQAKVRRSADGGQGPTKFECSGEAGSGANHRENVREGAHHFYDICQEERPPRHHKLQPSGSASGGLYEPMFLRGPSSLCWRQADRQLASSSSRVQPYWCEEDPQSTPSAEGLEAFVPRKVTYPLSSSSMVRPQRFDAGAWISQDGNFSHDVPVHLCAASRTPTAAGDEFDSPSHRGDQLLVHPDESRGARPAFENGRVRHQSAVRLSLSQLLGCEGVQQAEDRESEQLPVGLQLQSVFGHVQEMRQTDGHRAVTISHPSQWSLDRSLQELQEPARCAEAWTMEKHQVHCPLRKSGTLGQELGASSEQGQGILPGMRRGIRRHHGRPKEAPYIDYPRRSRKGQYVADLFSGQGGVARACEALGFQSREWDIRYGQHCDLTSARVLSRLKQDIKWGRVLAVMLAPPGDSFSAARDRASVVRTRDWPWGLPPEFLSIAEQKKIQLGNACFRSCISLIRLLDRHRIPWILENSASSKCWYLPYFHRLCSQPHVQTVISDFCQFGTRWRKRTRFCCGNIELDDLHRLQHKCSGHGMCSRTGRPHFQLTGTGPGNRNWTAIAQSYPVKLSEALAYSLTARWHYNSFSY